MSAKAREPFDPKVLDQPKRDDGGPASEMSLRDHFAAKSLPYCIHASQRDGHYDEVSAAVAAYVYADAMLKERAKGATS